MTKRCADWSKWIKYTWERITMTCYLSVCSEDVTNACLHFKSVIHWTLWKEVFPLLTLKWQGYCSWSSVSSMKYQYPNEVLHKEWEFDMWDELCTDYSMVMVNSIGLHMCIIDDWMRTVAIILSVEINWINGQCSKHLFGTLIFL